MKLLHTSDWHLGATDNERSLREDQVFFIEAISRIIAEKEVDAVLLAGDVYDRSVASAEAIRLYDEAMTHIVNELDTPVLMIAGNHDSAERLASCSSLLSKAGLFVEGSLKKEPAIVSFDDADVYLLPWITEEKVKSLYPEAKEEIKDISDAYRVVMESWKSTFTENKRHILVSHAFITDSETSTSDRAAVIGYASQVPASVFDGFDYVALGHIHKPQNVNDTVRYCGTPMPYSFGAEEKQEKSVTIIDTKTMEREIVPLPLLHRRTSLEGTLAELLHPDCTEEERLGYTRLRVTDCYVGLETLSDLRKIYPLALEVIGKTFEGEESGIRMSMNELEQLETDPVEIFRYFCRDVVEEDPNEHLLDLFAAAVREDEA